MLYIMAHNRVHNMVHNMAHSMVCVWYTTWFLWSTQHDTRHGTQCGTQYDTQYEFHGNTICNIMVHTIWIRYGFCEVHSMTRDWGTQNDTRYGIRYGTQYGTRYGIQYGTQYGFCGTQYTIWTIWFQYEFCGSSGRASAGSRRTRQHMS
jgi:hypothetical protein